MTQISASNAPTITIAYSDTADTWVAYSNSESTDTVFVDGAGCVAKQTTTRGAASYVLTSLFGTLGNRETLRVTSSAWSGVRELAFDVDTLGRPTFLSDFRGAGTSITYNQDHQPSVITIPTHPVVSARLRLTHRYLPNERLDSVSANVAPGLFNWRYQYDGVDRTRRQEWGVAPYTKRREIEFDGAGRVYHWTDTQRSQGAPVVVCDDPQIPSTCRTEYPTVETVTAQEWRTFDLVGNRTDGGAVLTAGDRLTSFNGFTMSYDADGNLVSKSGYGTTQTFTWNGLGQLTSVTTNGAVTSFGYDGLGRRVRKTVNGAHTRYLYDGDNLLMQLDANGVPQLEFSYYPGIDHPNAVKQVSTGATFYYVMNASNNVIALVNASNQVVNQYEYVMSGQTLAASEQVVQPFRFGAREFDAETGLYYNRARYYDPSLTRFISEDPSGLDGGVNPYAYANNNPVDFTDPSGLTPCPDGMYLAWRQEGQDLEFFCANQLQGVTTTARRGGGNTSGFSSNFGNPSARGGRAGAGYGGAGGPRGGPSSGPGGSNQPASPAEKVQQAANVVLACASDHYGLTAAGAVLAAAGANVIGTSGKFAGATPRTSVASIAARGIFGDLAFPAGLRLPTLTGFPGVGSGVRVMATKSVGAFVGRTIPVVGYALLTYDSFRIGQCAAER